MHYVVPLGGAVGPFSVEARLLYQAVKPTFVRKLSADGGRVIRFRKMYQMVPPVVETLATATVSTS